MLFHTVVKGRKLELPNSAEGCVPEGSASRFAGGFPHSTESDRFSEQGCTSPLLGIELDGISNDPKASGGIIGTDHYPVGSALRKIEGPQMIPCATICRLIDPLGVRAASTTIVDRVGHTGAPSAGEGGIRVVQQITSGSNPVSPSTP